MCGTLVDTVVNQGDYTVIKEIPTVFFASGILTFKVAAGGGNLMVRIWGDLGDFAYDQVVATEFLVTAGGAIVNKAITGSFSAIRIEAKTQGSDAGTLSTTVFSNGRCLRYGVRQASGREPFAADYGRR